MSGRAAVAAPWGSDNNFVPSNKDDQYKNHTPWAVHLEDSQFDDKAAFENELKAMNYKHTTPWELQSGDLMSDFEKDLRALNMQPDPSPWEEGSIDLQNQYDLQRKAGNYKFNNDIFQPPSLSAAKQKQLADYEYVPPYKTEFNTKDEFKKTPKRMTNDKRPVTRQPWTYGEVPADPVQRKCAPKPSTALWTAPAAAQKSPAQEMISSGDPVLDSLRYQLLSRGAVGIAGLSRKFRIMDDDGSKSLNVYEFKKGMKECKILDMSDKAIGHLFRFFDKDDSGSISFDEFMNGIRGHLNARRKAMIHMAFNVLDRDKSGEVDIKDLTGVYNAKMHPDFIRGKVTEEEVLQDFLQNFQVNKKTRDNTVTLEEFEEYYSSISASIDNDDNFELMIRNAWHISGGDGACANTTNKRVLVRHADGRETVEEIENDLGIAADDTKTMMSRLKQQGRITGPVQSLDTIGGVDNTSRRVAKNSLSAYMTGTETAQDGSSSSRGSRSGDPRQQSLTRHMQDQPPPLSSRGRGR